MNTEATERPAPEREGLLPGSAIEALAEAIYDWMRVPDWRENFSLPDMVEWLKQRPTAETRKIISLAQAQAASPTPGLEKAVEALEQELCGDEVNGGFIRSLSYTVWNICHNPTHEDGNSDWFNDTLPTVHKGVERVRAALRALQGGNAINIPPSAEAPGFSESLNSPPVRASRGEK